MDASHILNEGFNREGGFRFPLNVIADNNFKTIMDYMHNYMSPLGEISVASDGESLIGLWFNSQKYFGSTISEPFRYEMVDVFKDTFRWLDLYFSGKQPNFLPKIFLRCSEYRIEVFNELLRIPFGKTVTYSDISHALVERKIMLKASPRAVANAIGHNPISVIIPCHRVIGKNGNMTGYAAGIERKIQLLNHESAYFRKSRLMTE